MWRQEFGVTTKCGVTNPASPPNAASAIRRHHLMWYQQFGVTTQCGFRIRRHHPMRRQETIRRHDPMRRQGTIRRQAMCRHNSASPKAMRLQEFGFSVRSFTTLTQAAALHTYMQPHIRTYYVHAVCIHCWHYRRR